MDFDSSDNSDTQFAGKIKTQTFKQFQLERLIKDGKVIPASKLAEVKEQELQRVREFEAVSEDQQRHNRTATPPPTDKQNVTRTYWVLRNLRPRIQQVAQPENDHMFFQHLALRNIGEFQHRSLW